MRKPPTGLCFCGNRQLSTDPISCLLVSVLGVERPTFLWHGWRVHLRLPWCSVSKTHIVRLPRLLITFLDSWLEDFSRVQEGCVSYAVHAFVSIDVSLFSSMVFFHRRHNCQKISVSIYPRVLLWPFNYFTYDKTYSIQFFHGRKKALGRSKQPFQS